MPLPAFDEAHAPGISLPQDEAVINAVHRRLQTFHIGKRNAVKSNRIEAALGISGPKVRAIVNYLNSHGVWVASCGQGYYYAEDADEREEYLNQLISRRNGIDNRIRGLTS